MRYLKPVSVFIRLLVLLALAFPCLALPGLALAENVTVTFVLVNDVYEMDESGGRGGFARLATAVNQERAANPDTIVVNAGDLLSPSLLSGLDRGEHMIALSNMIGTDVLTPGNHEFDFGKDNALVRMRESEFPWIAANMTDADGQPVDGIAATLTMDFTGVNIGFVGLAEENTHELSSSGDLQFLPAVETGLEEATELRAAGADFVVAINHNTRKIAEDLIAAGAADLVLNGHNHDLWLFYNGRGAAMESQSDAYQVAVVDITFDTGNRNDDRPLQWWPTFRVHDSRLLEPDPDVARKVAGYAQILDEELAVELGRTTIRLDSRKAAVRGMETAMGNLIADAMRAAVGADLAITNGGGIRGNRVYEPGTVLTRRDILAELPFGTRTLMVELSGAQVMEALENGVSRIESGAGRFPQVSGLSFSVDRSKPPGTRIADLMTAGRPIEPSAHYKVATNDYMARGGDGYDVIGKGKLLVNAESARLMANDVMVHLRKLGEIGEFEPRIHMK